MCIRDSAEYMGNLLFVRKLKDVHKGKGVIILNEEEKQPFMKLYKHGSKCGRTKFDEVIQEYVGNTLLLDGRKFNLRVLVVVVSVEPLIVYYYDSYVRLGSTQFNKNVSDTNQYLSNTGILGDNNIWSMERLQEYLLKNGQTKNCLLYTSPSPRDS
eukprot:TRINITY_DN15857_c0_g1_i1.p2 TRINITY_DN15857_c0_g1~~TRINITY_DN15857_c0_g1_i1.p2  ORF type:complete len:166 (+),score=31.86 TRINITY_DN15857_c0_g1_i1:32-499(+)